MVESLFLVALQPLLQDGGPLYAETDLSAFPVEPWNAWSSLTFWVPAVYFIWKVHHSTKRNVFLIYCCVLLFMGGTGSALYHAFRSYTWLLMMDIVPIALLTLSVSVFFWNRILPRAIWVAMLTVAVIGLRFLLFRYLTTDTQTAINISYFISGTFMLLPVLLLLLKTNARDIGFFGGTLFFLLLALFCRAYDEEAVPYISIGIHWLWHTCTAIAAGFLGEYLFRLNHYQTTHGESEL